MVGIHRTNRIPQHRPLWPSQRLQRRRWRDGRSPSSSIGIDTPGAYPGIGAEERGQSEAIARNLYEMSTLKTPIISIIIGEGGSGGALAIGLSDITMMFEYSIYSVISPEGCASILYKDASKASIAAESLKLTSKHLKKNKLVEKIIPEPLGGIHRNPEQACEVLKKAIKKHCLRNFCICDLQRSAADGSCDADPRDKPMQAPNLDQSRGAAALG